ncbi:hypothetical protein AU210_014521 [Fusarium oxysporum f. sp. radicis-cucumerinum]|uniref:Uncharacterized protein n=1 Tax=Fusarium oxysporum f. sp. radicis-cucumerinum TaxID=327505 RepID=A0A2H3GFE5_FUSOX|nr:hypothetical protein AU210_014521 [Fusarium oxysporum f. sp. radicis-cucumerinum]
MSIELPPDHLEVLALRNRIQHVAEENKYVNDENDHLRENNGELALENDELKKGLALAEQRLERLPLTQSAGGEAAEGIVAAGEGAEVQGEVGAVDNNEAKGKSSHADNDRSRGTDDEAEDQSAMGWREASQSGISNLNNIRLRWSSAPISSSHLIVLTMIFEQVTSRDIELLHSGLNRNGRNYRTRSPRKANQEERLN